MYKLIFAGAVIAATMATVTASAHVWNRPAAPAIGQAHLNPCPVSYSFQRGFCVRTPASKKAWFAKAIDGIL